MKKFREKISSSAVVRYSSEFYHIEDTANAIDIVLDYYNESLVFAKDNQKLKNNYKPIKEGLQKSREYQKKMNKIIAKTNKFTDSSSTYLQGAIVDYRKAYVGYLNSCRRAINGLEKAYAGSQGVVLYNNPATALILSTVSDYLDVIVDQYKQLVKVDVKGGNIMTYEEKYKELGLKAKVEFFTDFVENKVKNEIREESHLYYFNQTYQAKYEKLNKFFEVYQEKDVKPLIESIKTHNAQSSITKAYTGIVDNENLFAYMADFLGGEV